MEARNILLPNRPDTFLLAAMREQLQEGHEVRIAFGGISMLPLISGTSDIIRLRPLREEEEPVAGDVYLFCHLGHHIVHRLLRREDDIYVFRGDNCYGCERVRRQDILARLTLVEHPDGTSVSTDSATWHEASRRVVRRRDVKNFFIRWLGREKRKVYSVVYFILLALLMWAPVGGLGVPLDNFIFGIRLDHLLHASIYLLCPAMLVDILRCRRGRILLTAIAIGLLTEGVQYLLPYRGFDINDLVANALGALLGWLAILPYLRRKARHSLGTKS
jgi:VanZ family protein